MIYQVDPAMIAVGLAIFAWVVRVDRKITKFEAWFKSCKTCRENVHPNGDYKK